MHHSISSTLKKKDQDLPVEMENNTEQTLSIDDLELSLLKLKSDMKNLNDDLIQNYGKSLVFAGDSYDANRYSMSTAKERNSLEGSYPRHLKTSMGNFPTSTNLGVSTEAISPTTRRSGLFGSEMATKNIDGQLTPAELSSNSYTFPVKLTAPHIVGVRSLCPPKYPMKHKTAENAMSYSDGILEFRKRNQTRTRCHSPRPVWMPSSKNANACAQKPPEFRKKRPATAIGFSDKYISNPDLLEVTGTRHSFHDVHSVKRQIHPRPSETELTFLKCADEIDTRRALVENSPYQNELARLRLERLRVEEEYLLQLKLESELERTRGPKRQWYAMKGPEFHYECNKNTSLNKNKKSWGDVLQYRNKLLQSSRDFSNALE